MRHVIVACILAMAFGIAVDLCLLLVTADDPVASFDPHDAATELRVPANALRKLQLATHTFVQDLLDAFTAPYREQLQRRFPTAPLPE